MAKAGAILYKKKERDDLRTYSMELSNKKTRKQTRVDLLTAFPHFGLFPQRYA
jgi:hypothetical protein